EIAALPHLRPGRIDAERDQREEKIDDPDAEVLARRGGELRLNDARTRCSRHYCCCDVGFPLAGAIMPCPQDSDWSRRRVRLSFAHYVSVPPAGHFRNARRPGESEHALAAIRPSRASRPRPGL